MEGEGSRGVVGPTKQRPLKAGSLTMWSRLCAGGGLGVPGEQGAWARPPLPSKEAQSPSVRGEPRRVRRGEGGEQRVLPG